MRAEPIYAKKIASLENLDYKPGENGWHKFYDKETGEHQFSLRCNDMWDRLQEHGLNPVHVLWETP